MRRPFRSASPSIPPPPMGRARCDRPPIRRPIRIRPALDPIRRRRFAPSLSLARRATMSPIERSHRRIVSRRRRVRAGHSGSGLRDRWASGRIRRSEVAFSDRSVGDWCRSGWKRRSMHQARPTTGRTTSGRCAFVRFRVCIGIHGASASWRRRDGSLHRGPKRTRARGRGLSFSRRGLESASRCRSPLRDGLSSATSTLRRTGSKCG